MQAFILAAGNGERLKPITSTQSKCMIPIAGKPILHWVMNSLDKMDIHVIIRKDQKDVENFLNGKAKIIYQDRALGTAHAVMQCEQYAINNFLVCNGDDIFLDDLKSLKRTKDFGIACKEVDDTSHYGRLELKNGNVLKVLEKENNSGKGYASCGAYIFDSSIFNIIKKVKKSKRGEFEITDAINIISGKTQIKSFSVKNWQPINYPWDLLDANKLILDKYGSTIDGEVRKGAEIEEPVFIGEDSVVGPNCFIRKYSSIGKNCRIGNAVEIKNSIVMENSFVSHLTYVGDSIIGRNCNIGAGTIFANLRLDEKNIGMCVNGNMIDSKRKKMGAVVGDNVKMGVNTTVMPGKSIAANRIIQPCLMISNDVM